MIKRLILFFVVFSFFGINLSYGSDWKKLHEKADIVNLPDAITDVIARPGSTDDLYVLGLVYLNLHKDKEAGGAFNNILTLNPKVVEAKWGVAEVLRRQHQPEKSEELLSEVLKSNPDFHTFIAGCQFHLTAPKSSQWNRYPGFLGSKSASVSPASNRRFSYP